MANSNVANVFCIARAFWSAAPKALQGPQRTPRKEIEESLNFLEAVSLSPCIASLAGPAYALKRRTDWASRASTPLPLASTNSRTRSSRASMGGTLTLKSRVDRRAALVLEQPLQSVGRLLKQRKRCDTLPSIGKDLRKRSLRFWREKFDRLQNRKREWLGELPKHATLAGLRQKRIMQVSVSSQRFTISPLASIRRGASG